jgi:hypothetical protein
MESYLVERIEAVLQLSERIIDDLSSICKLDTRESETQLTRAIDAIQALKAISLSLRKTAQADPGPHSLEQLAST